MEERNYSGAALNALMEEETKESLAKLYLDLLHAPSFTVHGAHGEYRFALLREGGVDYISVDGVRCTAEILQQMIVSPDSNKLLRFERNGDMVTARVVSSIEVMK